MKIRYRDDCCGTGKTRAELIRMAEEPGKYVLALDRRDAIRGRAIELISHAARAGTTPVVQVLCSPGDGQHLIGVPAVVEVRSVARRGAVLATIAAVPEETWHIPHLIVIVTHEGLGQADLSAYAGWHLVIDEVPSAWECASERSPALMAHLEAAYTLRPIEGTGWSRVLVRDDALTLGAIRADETLHRWGDFHRRVQSRRGVVVSLTDWAEVASGRRWNWWSLWTPEGLGAFSSVTVCAHAFPSSVTARLWASVSPEITWERVPTPSDRAWAPRRVVVRYATNHVGGTYFWAQPAGRACLQAWAAWIATLYPAGGSTPHLVTSNEANRAVLLAAGVGGDHPSIRVSGSNDWTHVHDVSVAYAAKASPHEATILEQFGVTSEQVTAAREHEDIVQFVTRTSLRDPRSTADVWINVYDHVQAEVVASYLRRHYPFQVAVEHRDIGINEVVKPRPGRPPAVATAENRERAIEHRKIRRAVQQRARRARRRTKDTTQPLPAPRT